MTTATPLDRLATLAAQRTARTDRLQEAVQTILRKLDEMVEVGTSVTVGRYTLRRVSYRSNVGLYKGWCLDTEQYGHVHTCDIDRDVGDESYVHGDFNLQFRPSSRADLIVFAQHAKQFVDAFIKLDEETIGAIDAGVNAAFEAIPKVSS